MIRSDAMRQKLANYGIWTYRSAWALEIVAAGIGLATGLFLGIQAFRSSETAEPTDLVLASAPFFMVALAELTKIPIATLLFSVRWVWKPILALFLLLLALITFETVLMGLERSTALRQLRYQELVKEQEGLTLRLRNVAANIEDVEKNTSVQDAQNNIERINQLAEEERKAILAQIGQVDAELEGGVTPSPEAVRLKEQIKDQEAERAALLGERKAEIDAAYARFESQRNSYTERLQSSSGTESQKSQWAVELSRLKNPVPTLQGQYSQKLEDIDKRIDGLRSELEKERSAVTTSSNPRRSAAEARRAELTNELNDSSKKCIDQRDAARKALNVAQEQQASRAEALVSNREEQQSLKDKITELEGKRIVFARQDQVQRIASRIYRKKPEDVTEGEANFIAVIWFGSLAALAALTGPITAIVALGLQRIGLATDQDQRQGGRLSRLLRRLLLSWRWKRTRTTIVKEQVPVEKIVKEILYVPILTDDPNAVRQTILSDLPTEVADLVKMTLAGKNTANASPA